MFDTVRVVATGEQQLWDVSRLCGNTATPGGAHDEGSYLTMPSGLQTAALLARFGGSGLVRPCNCDRSCDSVVFSPEFRL
jgi:hypothetical protein